MKIDRTKNASRNILFGIILKIYQLLVPFLMRTAMIYFMGVQYLGLNSLFTSVLQVLNLAELGVGSAMIYSMYRPITEDDKVTICALMKLYRTYYRIIGLIIAVIGSILIPFIPNLIAGEVPPEINVYVLYVLNLSATVLSYWLFAYKNSILQAHQRNDVISKVTILTNSVQYLFQFLVLWLFRNYYLFVIVLLITQALTNIVTAIIADRLYPEFKPGGKVQKSDIKRINRRIKDLFTSKLGTVVYESVDTIVISAFLGLSALAIYQNYFYILTAVSGFISVIFTACTAGIGNSIVVETKEKNFHDFEKFTFIISWIAGFCSVCMLCLLQPFMKLWVGEDLMLAFSLVCCFVVYFFLKQINSLFNLYKDASGIWHEDRFRPLAAAMTNLVLNLILVQFIGLYGILISTVSAILFVGYPWLLHNLFTLIFDMKNLKNYLKKIVFYFLVIVLSGVVTYFLASFINFATVPTLLLRGVICLIVPNAIYFVCFRKTKEFKQSVILADNMKKGKIKFIKKLK